MGAMQSVSPTLAGADHGAAKRRLPRALSWPHALRMGMGPDVRTLCLAGVENSSTEMINSQGTSERKARI